MSLILVTKCFPVVVFTCIALFFVSCNSGSEVNKKEVLEAVKHYNGMMRRAYMEANINLMYGVATENQVNKILPTILAMRAENSFMMANQENFDVKKVKAGKDRSSVETEERWRYWWQDKDTSAITKPEEVITYRLRYNLVQEAGAWKVDSIESTD